MKDSTKKFLYITIIAMSVLISPGVIFFFIYSINVIRVITTTGFPADSFFSLDDGIITLVITSILIIAIVFGIIFSIYKLIAIHRKKISGNSGRL